MGIERIAFGGWHDACRLSNGIVSLVVVPSVARIMHLSFTAEPNVLWTNAWAAGKSPVGTEWSNFGGNKVWIWPQISWPDRTGRAWPPAMDLPGTIVHTLEQMDDDAVRLTSPPIAGFGARIRREIRLINGEARVEIVNRVEKLAPDADFSMAAWTVSQLPGDGLVLGRMAPDTRVEKGYRLHIDVPWAVTPLADDLLGFERPGDAPAKLGFDGSLLAWAKGDVLFVERSTDAGVATSDFEPGDRAQVYGHIDLDPGLPPGTSYVELELTSPLKTLHAGEDVTLTTSLELHRLPPDERSPASIADRLRRLR
jgi:hypothetical protein